MNNIGPKLRDVAKAGSLGELDHYIVEIGGKIYRVPATYVSNLLTGNKYGVAYTTTQPPASLSTGDWYFAGENGDYPNFGLTGVTSGGFIAYNATGWVFIKNSNIKPPVITAAAEPFIYIDKNNIVYWTLPAATGNILRFFSATEGTSGKIYVKTTADISSIELDFHPVADESQGHIDKVVISKQTEISPIAGETTLIYWRVINGEVYLEYTNTERKIFLSDTDPAIVTTPAEKRVIFGTYLGKMWSKNSDGVVKYYTTENKSEYISQGNSYVENVKEAIRKAAGKVYASAAGFVVGSLMYTDIWKKASLVLAPIGTKAGDGSGNGTLYSVNGSNFTSARNSKKRRIDTDGYIRQVGLDEAAIDYSDGKAAINSERQSTNKYLYPFSAENTYSTKTGLTVDTNGGAFYPSPFKDASGNVLNVARKLVEANDGTGTDQHFISKTISGVTSPSLTVIAKAGERDFLCLYFASGSGYGKVFDLRNGTLGAAYVNEPSLAKITPLADGYYACSIMEESLTDGATSRIFVTNNEDNNSYTGDGTSGIYIAGIQFKEDEPTSFINDPEAAEGSEVTVLQDDIHTEGISQNVDEFTFFLDYKAEGWGGFSIGNNSPDKNNSITIFPNTSPNKIGVTINIDGSWKTLIMTGTYLLSEEHKIAIICKNNFFSFYIDGTLDNTADYSTESFGITKFTKMANNYGADSGSDGKIFNGYIYESGIINRALTSEEAINETKP